MSWTGGWIWMSNQFSGSNASTCADTGTINFLISILLRLFLNVSTYIFFKLLYIFFISLNSAKALLQFIMLSSMWVLPQWAQSVLPKRSSSPSTRTVKKDTFYHPWDASLAYWLRLIIFNEEKTQEKLWKLSGNFPFVRDIHIYKGNLHYHTKKRMTQNV